MFGLFKENSSSVKVIDKVWMSKQAKWNACLQMAQLNTDCLFIAWFDETRSVLQQLASSMNASVKIILARSADAAQTQGRMVVFLEHYPLAKVEQDLFLRLNLREVPILSSLDEPLFMKFGGEKTIDLMKNLGMKEDEVIGHTMITKAIRRAQESMEKMGIDHQAASQREWFAGNTGN
jgi:hypothetical protein